MRLAVAVAAAAWILVTTQLLFFALFQPIWSPIDEFNHFFYVNYLNYTHRPPLIGVQFQATLDPAAPPALSIPPSRGRGVVTQGPLPSTEGIQPPGYYALMIPVFKTAAHGTYDQVTRVRLATAALAALLIPLTFILARIVAPQTPWVWGAASVLPALSRGYSFNLSQVTNDALALLVGAASALVLLWLLRARLNWVWGAVAGVTAGTAAVTKVTVYFVPIFLAIAFLWRARRDWHLASVLSAAATGIGIGAAVAIPWVYFNWRHYHALVGTTPFPPNLVKFHNLPLLDALRVMVSGGSIKFWAGEMVPAAPPPWLLAAGEIGLLVCVAGFLLRPAWLDGNRSDQMALLAWAIGGIAFLFVLVLSTHVAVLAGRYLYPLFAPAAVASAIGADRLGRPGHWLFMASAGLLLVAMIVGLASAIPWVTQSCTHCAQLPANP